MADGVNDGENSFKIWTVQVICRKCQGIKDVIVGKYLMFVLHYFTIMWAMFVIVSLICCYTEAIKVPQMFPFDLHQPNEGRIYHIVLPLPTYMRTKWLGDWIEICGCLLESEADKLSRNVKRIVPWDFFLWL